MRFRSVMTLVIVALVAGAIAAHADGGPAPRPARAPVRVITPPVLASVAPRAATGCAAPAPIDSRRRTPQAPKPATAAPPSQALLDAFAILRRARTDADALSPQALEALRLRGLSPVSLDSTRLLRSTSSGGRAWVVPVPDVVGRFAFACRPFARNGHREGLVVVAVGDAASGGGGALDDLVRGRSPVAVAPCAGPDHSMLSISGIVPNGVPAAFLTAPDGTAVRADVKDNGYEFLLPNQRRIEERYVVWTGGDGTPHVQPVVTFAAARPSACQTTAKLAGSVARVSPDGLFPCATPGVVAVGPPAAPARRASRAQRLRLTSALRYVVRCTAAVPFSPKFLVPGARVPAPLVLPARPVPAPTTPPRVRKRR